MWFEKLVGFKEVSPDQVRANIQLAGDQMISQVNGKSYQYGSLEIPSLVSLRKQSQKLGPSQGTLQVSEQIGDVQWFHVMPSNRGALFQAASQFNLLEMVNPKVRPEDGIAQYEYDKTQGPACAIACGAGTIYRNYFVELEGQIGQTADQQVDCLNLLGQYFDNENLELWTMENGYAFAKENGLRHISAHIQELDDTQYEALKGQLRVGLQWDTEVTINPGGQLVSQIYCSGLPVAYSQVPADHWEAFARLILEATYEATLHAGLINANRTGNNQVFLTLVGGGVFGNKTEWIKAAILKAMQKFARTNLDLIFISYGSSNALVREIIQTYQQEF